MKGEHHMLTVNKQDVSNLLLLEYLSSRHVAKEKLRLFEHKYHTDLVAFSAKIQSDQEEDFQAWDDYIEWKAYVKLSAEIDKKIAEIRHGHFEVA
jgi:hypothetical protein